jgi:arginine decarboxylase
MTTLPDTWAINQQFIILAINNWEKAYERVFLGGVTCDSQDYYNSEAYLNAVFLPKIHDSISSNGDAISETTDNQDNIVVEDKEAGDPQYIGMFNTGAYQESVGGYGGVQHCLTPAPKHIIIYRNEEDEICTKLFAKEQSYKSMLKILGY